MHLMDQYNGIEKAPEQLWENRKGYYFKYLAFFIIGYLVFFIVVYYNYFFSWMSTPVHLYVHSLHCT